MPNVYGCKLCMHNVIIGYSVGENWSKLYSLAGPLQFND